jgi:hypothetical protein
MGKPSRLWAQEEDPEINRQKIKDTIESILDKAQNQL